MCSWNSFHHSGPIRITRASGARVWDEEGVERIDWIMGWGSLLLGHTPQFASEAINAAVEVGFGCQYESQDNLRLASRLHELIPSAECMRLANSGTEATLHALRISRAMTGRRKVLKFEGHFHGLNDYLLFGVDGGKRLGQHIDGGLIEPVPGSRGLPEEELADLVVIVSFNDVDAVEKAFELHGHDLAAVIVEPISLNTGCIFPRGNFLAFLREICSQYNTLLVFDEILTGFRVAPGGAQEIYNVSPDLTCLGKAMGCGFPVAAVCGKRSIMESLAPVGSVEMAGTNTGRRLAVIGALRAIESMQEQAVWARINYLNDLFVAKTCSLFQQYGVPASVQGIGGRIGIHIGLEQHPCNFREIVSHWNRDYHVKCYLKATEKYNFYGFLLPLGPCPEPVTLSAAHSEADLDETLNRLESLLRETPYTKL
ncbi:Glutamate-1-semialdehyde 2,1-aminomutase [Pseudomonas fluorescens]|nr:Glutamate-1-semialdehyde 2,1-aminomutase [Pseudomonas fluorescens]